MLASVNHCFDFFGGVAGWAAHFCGEEGGEIIFVGKDGSEEVLCEFLTVGEREGVAEGFEGGEGTGSEEGDIRGGEGRAGG